MKLSVSNATALGTSIRTELTNANFRAKRDDDVQPVLIKQEFQSTRRPIPIDDALSACLMFDYLRSQNSLRGRQGLLTADVVSGGAPYSISVRRPDDGLAGAKEPAALKKNPLMSVLEESWIGAHESSEDSRRTNLFVQPITARASKGGGSTLVRTAAVYTRIFLLQGKH